MWRCNDRTEEIWVGSHTCPAPQQPCSSCARGRRPQAVGQLRSGASRRCLPRGSHASVAQHPPWWCHGPSGMFTHQYQVLRTAKQTVKLHAAGLQQPRAGRTANLMSLAARRRTSAGRVVCARLGTCCTRGAGQWACRVLVSTRFQEHRRSCAGVPYAPAQPPRCTRVLGAQPEIRCMARCIADLLWSLQLRQQLFVFFKFLCAAVSALAGGCLLAPRSPWQAALDLHGQEPLPLLLPGENDECAACTHVRMRKPSPPGRGPVCRNSPLFACCDTFCSGLQQPATRQEGSAVVTAASASCSRHALPLSCSLAFAVFVCVS